MGWEGWNGGKWMGDVRGWDGIGADGMRWDGRDGMEGSGSEV